MFLSNCSIFLHSGHTKVWENGRKAEGNIFMLRVLTTMQGQVLGMGTDIFSV